MIDVREMYIKNLEKALDEINNIAVGFHEGGPYCENEPPIIRETMELIEFLSRKDHR